MIKRMKINLFMLVVCYFFLEYYVIVKLYILSYIIEYKLYILS